VPLDQLGHGLQLLVRQRGHAPRQFLVPGDGRGAVVVFPEIIVIIVLASASLAPLALSLG
jgi:hypothetical protein